MKSSASLLTSLAIGLAAVSASAGPLLDSYWPLNHGDHKVFVYGNGSQLTIDVSSYGLNEYEIYMDSDEDSGSEYHRKDATGDYLTEVKVGWNRVSIDPDVLILDESLLQNGGTRTTSTSVDQRGIEPYPATFTVKVAKVAAPVTVPAGTFTDCRSVTVTEKASVPGYGTVTAQAMTAVLAPRVGIIKKLVKPGVWALLDGGTVGGVSVRDLTGKRMDTLVVLIHGQGTVTPNLHGQSLEVGKSYLITAKPDAGQVFAGWTGSLSESTPALTFTMQEDMVLEANFIPNPFAALKGTYNGLIHRSAGVTPESSGAFTLTVTDKGAYSMKLQVGGAPLTATGQLDGQGSASKTLTRPGKSAFTLQLRLEDSTQVSGTLSDSAWTAELTGDRAVYDGKTKLAPQAGQYTVVFPGESESEVGMAGDSFGTVTVDAAGKIRFAGTLADGTKVTQSAVVAENGSWPFYIPLYTGKGCILSWMEFTPQADSAISGEVTWIKPAQSTAKYYPAGFTCETTAIGSRYTRPAPGAKILNLTDAQLVLSDGNLAEPLTIPISLGANNKVTTQGNNKLTLTFTPTTGVFSGTIMNPATQKPIRFTGVVFQKLNAMRGFFLGTSQSGRVVSHSE